MATLDSLKIDGVSAILPPSVTYYNNKVGEDYNAVKGYVMKWDNGLMIITGDYNLGRTYCKSSWGVFTETTTEQWLPHFEEEFKDPPVVTVSVRNYDDDCYWMIEAIDGISTTRMGKAYFCSSGSSTRRYLRIDFIAVGMWK